MYKFIALYNRKGSKAAEIEKLTLKELVRNNHDEYHIAYEQGDFILYEHSDSYSPMKCHYLGGNRGVILGTLFHPQPDGSDTRPATLTRTALSESESQKIFESEGRWLRDNYWGSYVAFLINTVDRAVNVFRSPFGHLQCYHYDLDGLSLLFSDSDMLYIIKKKNFEIDWHKLASHIPFPLTGPEITPIRGLRLIRHGQCSQLTSNEITYGYLWKPTDFCMHQYTDNLVQNKIDELIKKMHNLALSCIDTWASAYPNALLALSDGFDSSVIAGIIGALPIRRNFLCVTACDNPVSDDTLVFAQRTAAKAGLPHVTLEHTSCANDPAMFLNCPLLPKPVLIHFDYETERKELAIAQTYGLTARWRGDGGDELFGRLGDNLAAIDYACDHKLTFDYFKVAMNSALVCDQTLWSALAAMYKSKFYNRQNLVSNIATPKELAWGINKELFLELNKIRAKESWLSSSTVVSPGSAFRAHSIMMEYTNFSMSHKEHYIEGIRPFYSQPLVEFLLRIPIYVLQYNGRERGLARTAFSAYLTDEVKYGLYKKGGSYIGNRIIDQNIKFLTEFILEGFLSKNNIVDRNEIGEVYSNPASATTAKYTRLLIAAGVEAWARAWLDA